MSVYVDGAKNKYGRMIMSHMLADTLPELLDMAEKIGVQRKWLQWDSRRTIPHFDICQSKRVLALRYGAIAIGNKNVVEIIRSWRRNG